MSTIYFDHASTTALDPRVREAMTRKDYRADRDWPPEVPASAAS